MQKKLEKLYNDCVNELKSINIDIIDNPLVGDIDLKIAKRDTKRYGCCKQEEPDKNYYHVIKNKKRFIVKYDKYKKHHIEISKWVMNLNDEIIKNTIMHEIIHCFPECNDHGKNFKRCATYINKNLGYNITRLGNVEEDYKKSNLKYDNKSEGYKYKIVCEKCGQIYYRQRLKKNFVKKYRCSKCEGKLKII